MWSLLIVALSCSLSVLSCRHSDRHPCRTVNKLTILHTNGKDLSLVFSCLLDIHAHFDPFNLIGSECQKDDILNNNCVGGVSRIKTIIDHYRSKSKNVLLFDAGDQFQGSLYFNIFGASPSAELMNLFKYDLMTIGNHEFDRGIPYLGEFFKNLTFPVVSSNIDLSTVPELAEAGVKPYVIFPKYKMGVIGFITNTTGFITRGAENVSFSNPMIPVQKYVDELNAQGIYRIVCVSHNGYIHDQYLAENTRGISLIVGGHSHSLLLKNASEPFVEGPYPTEVLNLDGKPTWIVQAHRFGDYVGRVTLEWNDANELVSLSGDPIRVDNKIPRDPFIQNKVDEWGLEFQKLTRNVVAVATDVFDMNACFFGEECPLGNLIADAFLEREKQFGAQIGMINSKGLRASINAGNVTEADMMLVLPFENEVVTVNVTGKEIIDVLERAAAGYDRETKRPVISAPQWSGLSVVYNNKARRFSKVESVEIQGEALVEDQVYSLAVSNFVAEGGDGIMKRTMNYRSDDDVIHVVLDYLRSMGELVPATHGRIKWKN